MAEIVFCDSVTEKASELTRELLEKYKKQLDYYELALGRLTGKRVKEKVIYSFCLKEEIPVPAGEGQGTRECVTEGDCGR